MSESSLANEKKFQACCMLDPEWVDKAIQAGLTPEHYANIEHRERWILLCNLRMAGGSIDSTAVFAEAHRRGALHKIGGSFLDDSRAVETSLGAAALLSALLDTHAKRESYRILARTAESLKVGTADVADVRAAAEQVGEICAGLRTVQRRTRDIADEAIRKAEEEIKGEDPSRILITTGLASFDKWADPIESHEMVVIGARTSHGKSSFMLQVAGHNLSLGRKVAIFSLETSDRAVLEQIVAQRVKINRRKLREEMPEKQRAYINKLQAARNAPNLVIFDRDMSMDAIAARCRLLAASFKPDLVCIDYLGLIQGQGKSAYERISAASKEMIGLRKQLGCTLMVAAQLNQECEKDERQPTRTDFRDSGTIVEDAHRVIALHREPGQPLDNDWYDYRVLQLKNRDGRTCASHARYHAPHTLFHDEVPQL